MVEDIEITKKVTPEMLEELPKEYKCIFTYATDEDGFKRFINGYMLSEEESKKSGEKRWIYTTGITFNSLVISGFINDVMKKLRRRGEKPSVVFSENNTYRMMTKVDTLKAHSHKAPAKKSCKKFVNPEAMF